MASCRMQDFAGSLAPLTVPPKFDSVDKERAYLKLRLTAALRIMGKLGYDHVSLVQAGNQA